MLPKRRHGHIVDSIFCERGNWSIILAQDHYPGNSLVWLATGFFLSLLDYLWFCILYTIIKLFLMLQNYNSLIIFRHNLLSNKSTPRLNPVILCKRKYVMFNIYCLLSSALKIIFLFRFWRRLPIRILRNSYSFFCRW